VATSPQPQQPVDEPTCDAPAGGEPAVVSWYDSGTRLLEHVRSDSAMPTSEPLTFALQPASEFELRMVSAVRGQLGTWREQQSEGSFDSGWLDCLGDCDLLRYTRSCIKGSGDGSEPAGEDEVTALVSAVVARLGATACWRVQEAVQALLDDDAYSIDSFFAARKAAPRLTSRPSPLEEVEWLEGRDVFGRPTAVFYADRHLPGEIDQS